MPVPRKLAAVLCLRCADGGLRFRGMERPAAGRGHRRAGRARAANPRPRPSRPRPNDSPLTSNAWPTPSSGWKSRCSTSSEAGRRPTRGVPLSKKAVEESKKREIDLQFAGTVDLLRKDQLSRALESQTEVQQHLESPAATPAKRRRRQTPRIGKETHPGIPQGRQRTHQAAAGRPGGASSAAAT